MARYRGPKQRLARRFGEPIFGFSKTLERKSYGPGQHGRARKRKPSEYKVALEEKQKVRYMYGMLERQFRSVFQKAAAQPGNTGEIFLKLLESRLDNTVYRLGFARTRRQARQLVNHKHLMVNGVVTNIPSVLLRPGDKVEIRERSKSLELINDAMGSSGASRFPWLELNKNAFQGTFLTYPERSEIPENIQERYIVELYSR